MRELDNYYRFLPLIPLLMITIKDRQFILIVCMCALGALGHFFWSYIGDDFGRYQGTSSSAITYANLCALFFIICIYFYFIKKNHSIYLVLSGLVFIHIGFNANQVLSLESYSVFCILSLQLGVDY